VDDTPPERDAVGITGDHILPLAKDTDRSEAMVDTSADRGTDVGAGLVETLKRVGPPEHVQTADHGHGRTRRRTEDRVPGVHIDHERVGVVVTGEQVREVFSHIHRSYGRRCANEDTGVTHVVAVAEASVNRL
jgi:hypothetical protein